MTQEWAKEKWFCEAGKSACDHDCGDECKTGAKVMNRLTEEEICKGVGCIKACRPELAIQVAEQCKDSGLELKGSCEYTDKRACVLFQSGSLAVDAQLSHLAQCATEEAYPKCPYWFAVDGEYRCQKERK